ncbi:MAG: hypothetical protein IJS08_03245 [Victivallales bacterium]|nr:hypothetical protein [Victivallales bacterium]
MKRLMLILFLVAFVLPLFGYSIKDAAIIIDDGKLSVEKWRVLYVAEELMKSQNSLQGIDKETEQQILRDVFLDFESWLLALVEAGDRNLQFADIENKDFLAFKEKSPYGKLRDSSTLKMVFGGIEVSKKLLEVDHINYNAHNVRDLVLAEYRSKHRIEVDDYTAWKVNRNRFTLMQDSNYNAIEYELDENSGKFKKTVYYVHHYTIRYYVLFLRWYILKAEKTVEYVKGKYDENVTNWISVTLLLVIPYLFHVLLVFGYAKLNNRKIRFFSMLFRALLLAGVSTILFYFGMSPWSLLIVCVGVPLGIYLMPAIWGDMSSGHNTNSGNDVSYTPVEEDSYDRSEQGKVITTITDENGCTYKGEGEEPETIEKQTPGDYAIFDRRIDGSYKERYGDRELDKRK